MEVEEPLVELVDRIVDGIEEKGQVDGDDGGRGPMKEGRSLYY